MFQSRKHIHNHNHNHTHGCTLSDQVTNHHVLFYLLISGCQSVLSVVGCLVRAAVALWPCLPLVLWQVPVGQRQRPQTICCILLEPMYKRTCTNANIWTRSDMKVTHEEKQLSPIGWWYCTVLCYHWVWIQAKKMSVKVYLLQLSSSLETLDGSTAPPSLPAI